MLWKLLEEVSIALGEVSITVHVEESGFNGLPSLHPKSVIFDDVTIQVPKFYRILNFPFFRVVVNYLAKVKLIDIEASSLFNKL